MIICYANQKQKSLANQGVGWPTSCMWTMFPIACLHVAIDLWHCIGLQGLEPRDMSYQYVTDVFENIGDKHVPSLYVYICYTYRVIQPGGPANTWTKNKTAAFLAYVQPIHQGKKTTTTWWNTGRVCNLRFLKSSQSQLLGSFLACTNATVPNYAICLPPALHEFLSSFYTLLNITILDKTNIKQTIEMKLLSVHCALTDCMPWFHCIITTAYSQHIWTRLWKVLERLPW